MKMIVCNAAWMNDYRGLQNGDHPVHGGSFVDRHGFGHELFNFAPNGDYFYGYVQTRFESINIDRLGADPEAPFVDHVLVVWRARSPIGSVVIGWYNDARVYRSWQPGNSKRRFTHEGKGESAGWNIRASTSRAKLIPPRFRTFLWPGAQPGFGSTAFVSFLDQENAEVRRYRAALRAYMKRVDSGQFGPLRGRKRSSPDSDLNLKIERAGIAEAMKYYEELGYSVKSVEKDKCGFDLVARLDASELLIEVKSTATKVAAEVCVGLTHNEFSKSKLHRSSYRICIVFDALGKPQLREYQWDSKAKRWFDLTSISQLSVKVVVAANLSIVEPVP